MKKSKVQKKSVESSKDIISKAIRFLADYPKENPRFVFITTEFGYASEHDTVCEVTIRNWVVNRNDNKAKTEPQVHKIRLYAGHKPDSFSVTTYRPTKLFFVIDKAMLPYANMRDVETNLFKTSMDAIPYIKGQIDLCIAESKEIRKTVDKFEHMLDSIYITLNSRGVTGDFFTSRDAVTPLSASTEVSRDGSKKEVGWAIVLRGESPAIQFTKGVNKGRVVPTVEEAVSIITKEITVDIPRLIEEDIEKGKLIAIQVGLVTMYNSINKFISNPGDVTLDQVKKMQEVIAEVNKSIKKPDVTKEEDAVDLKCTPQDFLRRMSSLKYNW